MKPAVPPLVVALACREKGVSIAEQAEAIGWNGERALYKRLKGKADQNGCCNGWWDDWQIGEAVTWCKRCGFDFWNLTGDLLTMVEWRSTRLYGHALELMLKQADDQRTQNAKREGKGLRLKVTKERIARFADQLNDLRQRWRE